MASDVPRLRYLWPKMRYGYTATMKTLDSALRFAENDPAQFRLHVLNHGKKHGSASAIEAFGISKRTYFNWKKKLKESHGKLSSLVPCRTCPKRTRVMQVDDQLLEFIKEVREEYGRIGKYKLKILVDAYAASIGVPSYGATKIGKIIERNHFFFEPRVKTRRLRTQRERVKYAPKKKDPGYVEMDSVHVQMSSKKLVFITVIDLATRVAYAQKVHSATSRAAVETLRVFKQQYGILVHTVQTDNGSEFLGEFHQELEAKGIKHLFSYPRTPKVNGMIERFNRTLQEEHVERTVEWWCDPEQATEKLRRYLRWYNEVRPHASLNYRPPLVYLHTITHSAICG